MLLLNKLNETLISKNKTILPIFKTLKIGQTVEVVSLSFEKGKLKHETLTGKIERIRNKKLFSNLSITIKMGTVSCLKTIYIHSPHFVSLKII